MAIGYPASLGDRSLDSGDAMSAPHSTFKPDSTLGTGQWARSGYWSNDGNFHSKIADTGPYLPGRDDPVDTGYQDAQGDAVDLDTPGSKNDSGDAGGDQAGTFTTADGSVVTFNEIETIICFTPGARILTQFGERAIETLHPGDMVVTRDHGLQAIRWIGQRSVPGRGDLAPVLVASSVMQGTRGGLLVSPQHRILFTGYRAELLFGESEVLVAARFLVNDRDVCICPRDEVTYIHLMFDRHEVIYAEGIATESFHAGDTALSAVTAAAREELFAIFPELRSAPGRHRETARHCLKRHEAQLLRGDSSNDRMV